MSGITLDGYNFPGKPNAISRAVKTENPVPRSFFAPKLNGNACYTGYCEALHKNTEFR